jgi:hypothetical protein
LGIFINNIRDFQNRTTTACSIYGVEVGKDRYGQTIYFSTYPTYDWVADNGYANLGTWVEKAASVK